ncbi:MAG TPA: FdtA/QdtA family cupin domain-containing protein [Xanthobacteraceae bacterium]|nr:FdtA/QdtA family cupin domain-containing protein [Xanthobacteraceae bacterium]
MNDFKHSELFQGRARLIPFAARAEPRGTLIPFDFGDLPFAPCHGFVVRDVPAGTVRGRHAHRSALQLLICVAGAVSVELRDAARSETVVLDRPDTGLLIGEGLWAAQTYLTPDAVLLVFLSEPYDPAAYLDEPRA